MKLLIIGGTGVLSSAVVTEAVRHNIEVTVINRGRNGRTVPNGTKIIKADYRNKSLVESLLSGLHFDTVIDFICYDKSQINYSIELLHKVAEQYIFISTTCVYNTSIPGIKDENAEKVLSSWDYSVNKWECEQLLEIKSKELGFNYSIIRPCVTYDDTRIPYGIMPQYGYHWTFISRILYNKPIIRWDGGSTKWNLMRVEDFATGVVGIIGNKSAYGEAYNLSGDYAYSWNDVICTIETILGVKANIFDITSEEYMRTCPDRKGEISGRSFDAIVSNAKIKTIVPDYKTNYELFEGISKTIEAYKTQNHQKGIDWSYDADIDRIIHKLCKEKGIDSPEFNLGFIDYLGTATVYNKITYWLERNREYQFVIILRKGISFCRNLIKHIPAINILK